MKRNLVTKALFFTKEQLYRVAQFIRKIRFRHLWYMIQVLFVLWLGGAIALAIGIHLYGNQERSDSADVIVVLGAGVRSDGLPNRALSRRTHHAADLWLDGNAPYILCTGGLSESRPNSEAVGCKRLLLQLGVPETSIYLEERSRSTEENAIYTRELMQANDWQTALVVSDSYHVLRAHYIFGMRGLDVTTSAVPSRNIRSQSFYTSSIVREVVALHWQVFKETLNIPVTHVAGV